MKIMTKVLFFFICISCGGTWGMAADYYVAKTGSDGNPGTLTQPWLTLQAAASRLRAGDTVYIRAGVYYERLIPQYSGSAGKYITFRSYVGEKVTIDGTGITLPDDLHGLVEIVGKGYIIISGLRVTNAGPYLDNAGIFIDGSHHIVIEKNYTYNTLSSGIASWNNSNIIIDSNEVKLACNGGRQECITAARTSGFEIKNNHVHHSGPTGIGGEGICLKDGSAYGKAYGNHVHHLYRLGIYTDAWDKHTHDIDVYGNLVHDLAYSDGYSLASERGGLLENIRFFNNIAYNNGITGLNISVNGDVTIHPMKNITIINNTLYHNGTGEWGGGLALDNPTIENVIIRNNIISDNHTFQLVIDSHVPLTRFKADHNLIDGFRDYEDETRGKNYIEGDPQFVKVADANFSLKEGSPAIDAGSAVGAPADDYAGNPRPQGSGYDIGAYEYQPTPTGEPIISLDREILIFAAGVDSSQLLSETLIISNSGTGTLEWSAAANRDWLIVTPVSGSGSSNVVVTANPVGLESGSYTGAVTFTAAAALNSPQAVAVTLRILSTEQDQPPFGSFATPLPGANVSGSIAVTGWALDDISVASVKIYRAPAAGEGSVPVYIGTATFIEGARPDVADLYPDYPGNTRAGWGYMLLTYFLPDQGNGTFTLQAAAVDSSGQETLLGTTTITVDNLHAVKPFGAIDNPGQGGIAAGSRFINGGWALTPQPNKIPIDGSTIDVFVDGVDIGHPVYNIERSDVAGLFPGYANSNGAGGYFYLDTTAYGNGVHTISWSVRDDAGNSDGIGSRYFTIQNLNGTMVQEKCNEANARRAIKSFDQTFSKVWPLAGPPDPAFTTYSGSDSATKKITSARVLQQGVCAAYRPEALLMEKGYNPESRTEFLYPDEKGQYNIEIKELERIVIYMDDLEILRDAGECRIRPYTPSTQHLTLKNTSPYQYQGFLINGDQLKLLPIGSTLDSERGVFYWQVGPGFLGEYRLVFLVRQGNGDFSCLRFSVRVVSL